MHHGIYEIPPFDWFRNYLTDRKQLVSFRKEISDPCLITLGVPQGSILGPFLFVLSVNDLPIDLERCQILMYADDTVMYFTAIVMPKKSVVLLPVNLPRLISANNLYRK